MFIKVVNGYNFELYICPAAYFITYPMRAFILFIIPIVFIACKKDNEISGSPELLIVDSVITTTVDDHGFIYISPPVNGGSNWISRMISTTEALNSAMKSSIPFQKTFWLAFAFGPMW